MISSRTTVDIVDTITYSWKSSFVVTVTALQFVCQVMVSCHFDSYSTQRECCLPWPFLVHALAINDLTKSTNRFPIFIFSGHDARRIDMPLLVTIALEKSTTLHARCKYIPSGNAWEWVECMVQRQGQVNSNPPTCPLCKASVKQQRHS